MIIEFPLKQPKRTRRLFPIVLLQSGKNKSSQHRGKEDKAVLAAVWKLPNFAADQEGFGSLSAARAIAWHGTGDSILIRICWVVPKAPAPAEESPCRLLGGVFASP